MYLQEVISKKRKKKLIFCWRLEGHWRKYQDPDPNPDQFVRGMDPRIRIRTKISWIRNTGPVDINQYYPLCSLKVFWAQLLFKETFLLETVIRTLLINNVTLAFVSIENELPRYLVINFHNCCFVQGAPLVGLDQLARVLQKKQNKKT